MDHSWYFSAVNRETNTITILSLIEDCSINSYVSDIRKLLEKTDTRNYRFYDIKQNKNEITITFYFSNNCDFDNFYNNYLIFVIV